MRSAGRRRWGITLVLIAVVLGCAALAAATTKTSGGRVTGTKTFKAKCPKGERIEVGGFRTTVNVPSGILIEDLTFKRQRIWKARFDQLGAPAPAAAIAYCAETAKLVRRTKTATQAPVRAQRGGERPLSATARCPRGTTVQLGGFEVDEAAPSPRRGGVAADFRPNRMEATSPRRWRVSGTAPAGMRLTAVAGCADLPAPDPVQKTGSFRTGRRSSVKAKCPAGSRVVMGGFRMDLFDGGGPYLRALKRPKRRTWQLTVFEFDEPGSMRAIAYCA